MTYTISYRQQVELDELKAFHFDECSFIDWDREAVEPFTKNEVGPNEKIWLKKEKNYSPHTISIKIGLSKIISKYLDFNKSRGRKLDQFIYRNWEEKYPFVKSMLEGNQECWRQAVKRNANFHKKVAIAKAYNIHVHDSFTVECDVYLHSIERVIPEHLEKVTKRGHLRYHETPKTQQYALYESYVYSCLNKITNDLFAVLPCQTIFLNGINGTYEDHYPIFSTVIERKLHQQERCPKRTIEPHRNMVTFKKRSGFIPLNRVYSPNVLFSKER